MTKMTRQGIRKAIETELRSGRLAAVGNPIDLGVTAILVENRLTDRIRPRPWQAKMGMTPLNPDNLKDEIAAEFKRLFDQLREPPRDPTRRPQPEPEPEATG